MKNYTCSLIPPYPLRSALCVILTITLASAGPIVGQNKSATVDRVSDLRNVDLSLAAPVPNGASGELVVNGGFETGDFTGWTHTGNTSQDGVNLDSAHSGTYGGFFGPVNSQSFISQILTTTVGPLYDLTLWLKNDGGTPNRFAVLWNGSVLDSINDGPPMRYTRFTYAGLTATTTSTPLELQFRHDPTFWHLDEVSVRLHVARAAPDFNGDSFPDLVLLNSSTLRSATWFLTDNSLMGTTFGHILPAGWKIIDAADFDGDGNVDYVLFNAGTRQTAIWYLMGTTFVSSAFGPILPAGWALVSTGEFNSDAHPDFVLFNATTHRTAIWFLNNNTLTGTLFAPTLPSGWALIGVADFNLDGRSDYALFKASTRQTAIWYLTGTTFVSSAFGPTPPSGWELIGVADFNFDGAPDYLLFNATTHRTAIWHLSNNTFVSSAFGPITPAGWDIVVP